MLFLGSAMEKTLTLLQDKVTYLTLRKQLNLLLSPCIRWEQLRIYFHLQSHKVTLKPGKN